MGRNLDLVPITFDGLYFASTRIDIPRSYEVYQLLYDLPELKPVSIDSSSIGIEETDLGQCPMAKAGHLAAIELPEGCAVETVAAWAYLKAIPPDTIVALHWT